MDKTHHRESAMYDANDAAAVYRNFLRWLFSTFGEDEAQFRQALIARLRLKKGQRLLITGCGLGDDVMAVLDAFGADCQVVASDLSNEMLAGTVRALESRSAAERASVELSACDACHLPLADNSVDAAFHFGGINLFDDPRAGIAEMTRVVKEGVHRALAWVAG